MRKPCKVTLEGDAFYVNYGDLLLDGALMSGVELSHDCRSGSCGTCRLRLVGGKVFGGTEDGSNGDYDAKPGDKINVPVGGGSINEAKFLEIARATKGKIA